MSEAINPITDAWALVAEDAARFDAALAEALEPQRAYLTDLERRLYSGGKKVRPLLLILAAKLVAPDRRLSHKAVQGAVSLEMLHVATLIHDDIVDEAAMRRGGPSVHAERGTAAAVLIGDLQFIQAIRVFASSIDTEADMGLVRLVLDVGFKICCGELDEMADDAEAAAEIRRQRYFQTIDRKTAILFGLACEVGATLAGARTRQIAMLSHYGRSVGRAFQIMDDLFDLVQPSDASGKPRAADLAARRWTLPIINAHQDAGPGSALTSVMAGTMKAPEDIEAARQEVADSDGFTTAYHAARAHALAGAAELEGFPTGPFRDALMRIAHHVVDRGIGRPPSGEAP
ncbi:MAG: polyprenyl synthetase family protein [Pseudomonadota bacterium]